MSNTKKKFLSVQDMVLIAVFTAIMAICSWISVSAGPVPFTLQTFAVFVTAALLGTKRGTIAVVVYILLGIIGVPVFAGLTGEPISNRRSNRRLHRRLYFNSNYYWFINEFSKWKKRSC